MRWAAALDSRHDRPSTGPPGPAARRRGAPLRRAPPALGGARRAGPGPAAGRRTDAVDDALAGLVPRLRRHRDGARFTDVDGIEYVDLCLGDTGAMTGHALPQVAEAVVRPGRATGITTMLPSEDAIWVAGELGRRFGLPRWQFAMSATDANRFVLRFARRLTGRPTDRGDGLVLPRHGRRDPGRARRRPGRAPAGRDGPAGRRRADHGGGAVQRPRRARPPARRGRRRVPADGAGAHQHRHRAARSTGYSEAVREITRKHDVLLVIDETHTLCAGPGGCTAAWGLEPDLLVVGKPIAGGVPLAAYGMTERGRRPADRPDARARGRRLGRRRHPDRQRARPRRGPGGPVVGAARGGLRRRDPAWPSGSPRVCRR